MHLYNLTSSPNRPPRAVFHKNPQLYDLGLNQTKLEDTLEVIQRIKELEKVFECCKNAKYAVIL